MAAPKDGSPTAATSPQAPTAAKDAADAVAGSSTDPISGSNSKGGAGSSTQVSSKQSPTHDPNSEENKKKTSWIGLELVYESNGLPVVGMPYEVTLPDGTTVSGGSTDEKGQARVDGIDPGSCQISFPTLDKEAWVDA